MDIKNIKKLKVGTVVNWYEPKDEKHTGFRMGYTIMRINYKRGLVWGYAINGAYWKHNSTQLNLSQTEISPIS
jgi:hypothetical protein